MHFDLEYSAQSEFQRPILCSPLTVAVLAGMSVSDISQQAIANLGWDDIRLTAPVFDGDTLYAETEVLQVRESQSRPHQGIVSVRTKGFNQHGTLVCSFVRKALVPKRGHGVEDRLLQREREGAGQPAPHNTQADN